MEKIYGTTQRQDGLQRIGKNKWLLYFGYYETEDGKICMDCLPDYARKYFLADLRTAMPRGRIYVP